jgi:hypothetical protein
MMCEDKGISYEEIEKLFGVLVMNCVPMYVRQLKLQIMSIMLR